MGTEENVTTIEYDDAEALRKVLVGQQIVRITETTGAKLHKRKYAGTGYSYDGRDPYDKVIEYHLSSGAILRAHAHDGGCACSNGCFSVDVPNYSTEPQPTSDPHPLIGSTILGVRIEESTTETEYWNADGDTLLETPRETKTVLVDGEGSPSGWDESTIDVFVYTELTTPKITGWTSDEEDALPVVHDGRVGLVQSQGGDNGYYGWGFHFSVELGASDIPAEFRVEEAR